MYIKEIVRNDKYTADIIVTDGKHDLLCYCWGLHDEINLNNLKPKQNVKAINAFAHKCIKLNKTCNETFLIKNGKTNFEYTLRGSVKDINNSTIMIGELIINLNQEIEDGLPTDFKNGDFVEFHVDRLDCLL